MGMYDSVMAKCPKCGNELEYQTKTGPCMMNIYGIKPKKGKKPNLFEFEYPSPDVAIGVDGLIVRCQFCNSRVQMKCDVPLNVNFSVKVVKQKKYHYDGNYNPKHPDSIKRMKELMKWLKK